MGYRQITTVGIWEGYYKGVAGALPYACGVKSNKFVRVEACSLREQVESGSYLLNYLSNVRVPFQIVRDEETQKLGTLNNSNVLIIDGDLWK